ncbi:hypothetical protein MJO29_000330 [Puccinia striiformis f. sp. tritici]|nr:hypothetical protein MJO29_000330 [Puccinia striiformis f. sp. tritici]
MTKVVNVSNNELRSLTMDTIYSILIQIRPDCVILNCQSWTLPDPNFNKHQANVTVEYMHWMPGQQSLKLTNHLVEDDEGRDADIHSTREPIQETTGLAPEQTYLTLYLLVTMESN